MERPMNSRTQWPIMVTPDAVVIAPPARLIGLLPKNSAGLTQCSRNFPKAGKLPPRDHCKKWPAPSRLPGKQAEEMPCAGLDSVHRPELQNCGLKSGTT